MDICVPDNWLEVTENEFKAFLEKCCRERTRCGWANGIEYRWRDNDRRFAFDLENGTVMVDAGLLQ